MDNSKKRNMAGINYIRGEEDAYSRRLEAKSPMNVFLDSVSRRYSNIYLLEHKVRMCAAELRRMVDTGLGRTNKPIPEKRMEQIKNKLKLAEEFLNVC